MPTYLIDGDIANQAYFEKHGEVFGFNSHPPTLQGEVIIFPTAHPSSRADAVKIRDRLELKGCAVRLVDVDALPKYQHYDDGTADGAASYFEVQCTVHFRKYPHASDRDQVIADLIQALPLVGWLEPVSLTKDIEPLDYPIDTLPTALKAAIVSVQHNVQSPLPMVATSLLTALATAVQGYYQIERDAGAVLPISLYSLIIADSGERKTSTDNQTFQAIADFERGERDRLKPDLDRYETALEAWTAERDGVKNRIKSAKNQVERDGEKAMLQALDFDKPERSIIPRLIFSDVTSEKLAHALTEYPSAVLKTSEAGVVFGGHLLSSDKAMATFALFNRLWEGGNETVDRKTAESFRLDGVRLSLSLQVQAPVLQDFLAKNGRLADGIGFLPRCLITNPLTTIGSRLYKEPLNGTAMLVFNNRLAELLARPLPLNEHGRLEPTTLRLTPEAKAAWVKFFDEVETEMQDGGEFSTIKGATSKIAENAMRVAALAFVFGNDIGMVDITSMTAGIAIARYHLREALRFFNELSLPPVVQDAVRLEAWLLDYCKTHNTDRVNKRYAQQHSPLRQKTSLDLAIEELKNAHRARLERAAGQNEIVLNPAVFRNPKNKIATATSATPATRNHEISSNVANVASVAVANLEIDELEV